MLEVGYIITIVILVIWAGFEIASRIVKAKNAKKQKETEASQSVTDYKDLIV